MTMGDWLSFWNAPTRIYVSEHQRKVALAIRAYVPSADATVIDCGCGEAPHADLVATGPQRLMLCELAPSTQGHL